MALHEEKFFEIKTKVRIKSKLINSKINVEENDTISNIKKKIYEKHNIQQKYQIIYLLDNCSNNGNNNNEQQSFNDNNDILVTDIEKEYELSNDICLIKNANINNNNFDKVLLLITYLTRDPTAFSTFSAIKIDKEENLQLRKVSKKPNKNLPDHYAEPGFMYSGICEYPKCRSYNKRVVCHRGFGEIYPYKDAEIMPCIKCCNCKNKFKPDTYYLYQCKCDITYKFLGMPTEQLHLEANGDDYCQLGKYGINTDAAYEWLCFNVKYWQK